MTALAVLVAVVGLALAAYYARLHFAWRAEVRRRRAEREREREQAGYRGYRTFSL